MRVHTHALLCGGHKRMRDCRVTVAANAGVAACIYTSWAVVRFYAKPNQSLLKAIS